MIDALIGIKKGMTSAYDSRGRRVGATVISLGPNYITAVKTKEGNDGYSAVQLGFATKKSVKKPQLENFKKVGIDESLRFLKETRVETVDDVQIGLQIKAEQIFSIGDAVKVTGVSKGRGFQGGVKRYGFHGGPKTHGQSDRHRAPGSIGAGTTPGRVYKGKKMAGHMGVDTVSIKGLEVLAIDRENSLVTLKGGIPGPIGAMVMVKKLGRIKGYTPPPEEKEDEEEPSDDKAIEGREETGVKQAENETEEQAQEGKSADAKVIDREAQTESAMADKENAS